MRSRHQTPLTLSHRAPHARKDGHRVVTCEPTPSHGSCGLKVHSEELFLHSEWDSNIGKSKEVGRGSIGCECDNKIVVTYTYQQTESLALAETLSVGSTFPFKVLPGTITITQSKTETITVGVGKSLSGAYHMTSNCNYEQMVILFQDELKIRQVTAWGSTLNPFTGERIKFDPSVYTQTVPLGVVNPVVCRRPCTSPCPCSPSPTADATQPDQSVPVLK